MLQWASQHGNVLTAIGGIIILVGSAVTVLGVFGTNISSDQKSREIADLNRELYEYTRGGDSYLYLHFVELGTSNQRANIVHCGRHPVRHPTIEIRPRKVLNDDSLSFEDKALRFSIVRLDIVAPQDATAVQSFPFDEAGEIYRILVRAENASHMQMAALLKVEGAWRQGYVVVRTDGSNGPVLRREHADPGFPDRVMEALRRDANLDSKVTPLPAAADC